jgi:DNA transposition AAA+ family ATPase
MFWEGERMNENEPKQESPPDLKVSATDEATASVHDGASTAPPKDAVQDTLHLVSAEGRVVRSTRMITPDEELTEARKRDICQRVRDYCGRHSITLAQIGREIGTSAATVSDALLGRKTGTKDRFLRTLNNWMELDARRRNVIQNREFVETSVAREIVQVIEIASETLCMAAIWGPARIGKSFTLKALEGSDRLGNPVLIRVQESCKRPFPLCRAICARFNLPTNGTFDRAFGRLVAHLEGTKRMLMFDEAERCPYPTLEFIRDLHDVTGCAVILAGKPTIYERLGFREAGDFKEVVDQLAGRIVIRRDLTERTRRAHNPEPLFSKEDIRKLIQIASLELKVTPDAVDWLQGRASVLGLGGFGKAVIYLYLAYKLAIGSGDSEITSRHLDAVEQTTIGHEDIERVEAVVGEASGRRIRRLA